VELPFIGTTKKVLPETKTKVKSCFEFCAIKGCFFSIDHTLFNPESYRESNHGLFKLVYPLAKIGMMNFILEKRKMKYLCIKTISL
jgi:hypothetical protein